jgi:hypothetical protein
MSIPQLLGHFLTTSFMIQPMAPVFKRPLSDKYGDYAIPIDRKQCGLVWSFDANTAFSTIALTKNGKILTGLPEL